MSTNPLTLRYPDAWSRAVTLAHGQHRGEGNVQIKYNNQWGAACDDKWSEEDAEVVCRELGFAAAAGLTVSNRFRGAAYRGFSYALDEAACDGTEASVSKCAGQWGKAGNCKQVYEWAGTSPFFTRALTFLNLSSRAHTVL